MSAVWNYAGSSIMHHPNEHISNFTVQKVHLIMKPCTRGLWRQDMARKIPNAHGWAIRRYTRARYDGVCPGQIQRILAHRPFCTRDFVPRKLFAAPNWPMSCQGTAAADAHGPPLGAHDRSMDRSLTVQRSPWRGAQKTTTLR